MKPLLISSGEPAGIGPDICLALSASDIPLVVMGDIEMIQQRAARLKLSTQCYIYNPKEGLCNDPNYLAIYPIPCIVPVEIGKLEIANAPYVLNLLTKAVDACLQKEFSALVTAPVHKGIINEAGVPFTGHTEFLAQRCKAEQVVMMLACEAMKVALVTTHLPLAKVPNSITQDLIIQVILQINKSLQTYFNIASPKILIAGLNPHAGEDGHLGREELDIIIPAIQILRSQGIQIQGPYPADTLFIPKNIEFADVFVCMYHDQGLTVLKYAGFGEAVNITLGLPIIRTSVDHGTALNLAGTGQAETKSMLAAVYKAFTMVKAKEEYVSN